MTLPLLKRPSALLPIGLAGAALTLPWIALAVFGPDPAGDEGRRRAPLAAVHARASPQHPSSSWRSGPSASRSRRPSSSGLQVAAFLVFILGK